MTKEMITKRIKELKTQIKYEKNKMKVCAYGKSDLMYLYGLEQELEELNKKLEDKNMTKDQVIDIVNSVLKDHFSYVPLYDTLWIVNKLIDKGVIKVDDELKEEN